MEKETIVELTMDHLFMAIPAIVAQRAKAHPDETILRTKDRGIWKTVTWAQLHARVSEIGAALLAMDFARGDVVAIVADARPEAVFADLATLGCGAASVAIDPDDDADRVCHQLSSSGSRLVFVENEEQLDKVLSIRDRCPALAWIVVFDMKGLRDLADPNCVGLSGFIETGGALDWDGAVRALQADQPAVIQFPRGEAAAMGHILTHGDLTQMVAAARARLLIQAGDERLAVLRLADITERVWGLYLALETRCISNYPERPDTAVENLQELQPTVLGADAAVWDGLHRLAVARAKAATGTQRRVYDWALRAGRAGGVQARLAELLVLNAVRREFGLNKVRLAYVGGASVSAAAVDWAGCLGISIQRVDEVALGSNEADERDHALTQTAYV